MEIVIFIVIRHIREDRKRLIPSSARVGDLGVSKQVTLMFMIAAFASGGLAILLAFAVRDLSLATVSIPGFVVGAFFAFKYVIFDKKKAHEEEHRRKRHKR